VKLYIFRHGITYFSKNRLPYGDSIETAEILPEGIPAIKRMGNYLRDVHTDSNFTSPYKRCIQTSLIISGVSSKKFKMDTNLRDWDPQKETVEGMIKRLYRFSAQLATNNHTSVAICTHGYPINALIAYFTKGTIDKGDLDSFPDPGVLVIVDNKKVVYKDFNQANS